MTRSTVARSYHGGMRIALEVWSADFDQLRSTCLRAEAAGLDGFYYGESPHGLNLDCWTTLGALGSLTDSIRLGPVITNVLPTYRSLVLLAKQAATVAAVAPGRVDFRTGVGAAARYARAWWTPFGVEYPHYDRRREDLADALSALPSLWIDMGAPVLPITVAARGASAMRLAVEHALVWETSFATPDEFAEQLLRLDELGGRQLTRSLEVDGFVATTRVGVTAVVNRVRIERGRFEKLDPILDRALVGTPDEITDQLADLVAVGVDQVVVALHDPHDPDAIEALAEASHRHSDSSTDRPTDRVESERSQPSP